MPGRTQKDNLPAVAFTRRPARWLCPRLEPRLGQRLSLRLPGAPHPTLSRPCLPPACRVESIMVSAPPLIAWKYNVQPDEGSEEARLVDLLRTPREWA